MDIKERTDTFIRSLEPELPEYLQKIEDRALEEFVPIIRRESLSVLRTLVAMNKPARILEIGTAVGFSTLIMRDELIKLGLNSDITTIEYFEPRFPHAIRNFKDAGVESVGLVGTISEYVRNNENEFAENNTVNEDGSVKENIRLSNNEYSDKSPNYVCLEKTRHKDHITMIGGDALEVLPTLEETYDLVFLDAAKAQYINMLPYIKKLMSVGGVLITDNILQDGDVLQSRYLICQRDRTIHARMREYLYAVKHDPELETTILPVGDGMTISVKK